MFELQRTLGLLAAIAAFSTPAVAAQQQPTGQRATQPDAARPADATANLPSDTGAQSTLPSGAVTGAGQPQGTMAQPKVGKPGGLEQRAREDASSGTGATGGQGAGATGDRRDNTRQKKPEK